MAEEKKKIVKKKVAPEKAESAKKVVKKKAPGKIEVLPTIIVTAETPEVKEAPVTVEAPKPHPVVPHHAEHHHHVEKKKVKKPAEKGIAKFYATGRRKSATARVWISPGSGKVEVNRKPAEEYFCGRQHLLKIYHQPYVLTNTVGKYDATAIVNGGGVPSQADALRMAIGRALAIADCSLHTILRVKGMLTRDPREKERKKYGLKRARRAFQFSKR